MNPKNGTFHGNKTYLVHRKQAFDGADENGLGALGGFGGGAVGKKTGVNFKYAFLEAGEKLQRLRDCSYAGTRAIIKRCLMDE